MDRLRRTAVFSLCMLVLAATLSAQARPVVGFVDSVASQGAASPAAGPGVVLNEQKGARGPATYIVELSAPPLASYRGGLPGLAPTNPEARGQVKLDATSPGSLAYLQYLEQQQAQFLASVAQALGRQALVHFQYRHAYNGLALELSPTEAASVAGLPGVLRVQREVTRTLQTDAGPAWIGAPGVWDGSATAGLPGNKGEGIVVGIIDTGINHDHPAFADVGGDGYNHTNPRGRFFGACDPVTGLPFCNDKLIGVYDFAGSSPEDTNGHGSHTASTVAGNIHEAVINAPTLTTKAMVSGVAPHANIISYTACIPAGCVSASLVAAINQAVADEVDVINYSIGGGSFNPWSDADAVAFLNARDAGVFVATSAGNSGPLPETLGSPADAPWLLSVAASTHDRILSNSLKDLSGGQTSPPAAMSGKSFTAGYGPARLIYAGAEPYNNPLCNAFTLGTNLQGAIVICDRGGNPRVEKGQNVKNAGGGGMVLANDEANGDSTVADPHALPAVHVSYADGQRLKAWVRDGGSDHTATIAGTSADRKASNGDVMAAFSSRGPNPAAANVLKPDVTAPGVDILAAVHTDPAAPLAGPEYALLSGTSMSSPHAAGAAALLRKLHPTWTPAEIQSALTTTASTANLRKQDGQTPATPFDAGAGRIDLTQAARAGLVLNETKANYEAADPSEGGDPARLNLASLSNGTCAGSCSWTRVVRNGLGSSGTWSASLAGAAGLKLTVSPSSFTLAPGESETLTITADVSGLRVNRWVFARLLLTPTNSSVAATQLPIAIKPGFLQVVDLTTGMDAGGVTVPVTSPIAIQQLTSTIYGMTPATLTQRQLEQDPTPLEPFDSEVGTFLVNVDVSQGAIFLTSEIQRTTAPDLDLYVGRDLNGDRKAQESEVICTSASETALERCRLQDPEGGAYWIMVQNWAGTGTNDVTLETVVIPGTSSNNLHVFGPSDIPAGQPFNARIFYHQCRMEPGQVWFALAELGSAPDQVPNVGSLLIKITRVEDEPGRRDCIFLPLIPR